MKIKARIIQYVTVLFLVFTSAGCDWVGPEFELGGGPCRCVRSGGGSGPQPSGTRHTLVGSVRDADTRLGLTGAIVRAYLGNTRTGFTREYTTETLFGRYELNWHEKGKGSFLYVEFSMAGYIPVRFSTFSVPDPDIQSSISFVRDTLHVELELNMPD